MRLSLFVIAGTLAWVAVRGSFDVVTLAAGLVLAWIVGRLEGTGDVSWRRTLRSVPAALWLLMVFAWEVLVSNLVQLRLVFAPRLRLRPLWMRYDTDLESPGLRALLGLMISMTPGTLTCDLTGRTLWIHVLDAAGEETVRELIRRRLERPLRAMERR